MPEYLVPSTFALADVGTALALVGVASVKNRKRTEKSLEAWWIAFM